MSQTVKPRPAADFSLRRDFLEDLHRGFALQTPVRWSLAQRGHETWILRLAGGERVVLRRYPPYFQEPWIRREHAVLNYLKGRSFPVFAAVPTRGGASFIRSGERYYALFDYCDGELIRRPWKRLLFMGLNSAAGRALAQYHRLAAEFSLPDEAGTKAPRYPWSSKALTGYCREVSQRESLTRHDRYYLKHAREAEEELDRLTARGKSWPASLSRTILHGDFGPHNVFFKDGRVAGVIDFVGLHEDIRAEEVASALLLFSKWLGPHLHLGIVDALLKAYQKEYPLEREALDLLPDLMRCWILDSLRWSLMQHYAHGRPGFAHLFADRLELARWIQRHQDQIKRIAG